MAPRKGKKEKTEEVQVQLGPQVRDGVEVFGVAHIYASFNDTFVHVTDPSGRETIVKVTGGMKVKADRDEASPYAAMLAAQDVAVKCKERGIGGLHIQLNPWLKDDELIGIRFVIGEVTQKTAIGVGTFAKA